MMNFKLIISTLAITLFGVLNAQEKELTIQINEGEAIIDVMGIDGKGAVIKTGENGRYSENTKNVNWKLWYVGLDGRLIWEKPIEKEMVDQRYRNIILSNISGSKIYHIEKLNKPSGNLIQQISLNGEVKKHTINATKWKSLSTGNLKTVFANDSNLCFILSKYGKETHPKKKEEEELMLYKIDQSTFSEKKINLKFPKLKTELKNTSFWSYDTHDERGIYFSSVFSEKTDDGFTIKVNVIKKDYYNSTLNDVQISFNRKNVERLNSVRATSSHTNNGVSYIVNDDILSVNEQLLPRSKCAVKIDTKNNFIYVFGLEQLKSNVRENHVRTIFIKKYDLKGKLIWEYDIEGLNAGTGSLLYMGLDLRKNGVARLETSGLYWDFSKDGKPMVTGKREDSLAAKYEKKNNTRERVYRRKDVGAENTVLIQHHDETGQVDVLFFPQ